MARTLADLYADIPPVNCLPGCRKCCGSIPMTTHEEAHAFFPARLAVVTENGRTAMLTANPCPKVKASDDAAGCSIHDKRPFMCRLFGTVEASAVPLKHPAALLICPFGAKPDKPLSAVQTQSLLMEYFAVTTPPQRKA